MGTILRYQDGQPFAGLVVVPNLTQGPDFVRAYTNGGSRFTFTGTADLRVQKSFVVSGVRVSVFGDVYNLMNLGEEVEEHVVIGPFFRTPTALQPSRTARLGVRIAF
jgi:hypothetical protein